MRSSSAQNGTGENNSSPQVLRVAPLNSLPYIGPLNGHNPMPAHRANETAEKGEGPAMIFLPSGSTSEVNNLLAHTTNGVALSGSAALQRFGPPIGAMDIAESDDSYFLRVALPGVSREDKDFSCEIEPEGQIMIKGATTTGEKTVCKYHQVFTMLSQNLCPPGHFTMSFQLPAPVCNEEFNGQFGADGVLQGVIKKLFRED